MEVYVPNPDDVVIAPERVWRDDIFTYIDLGKKALNMMQRPVVSMIVERVEVPVGFRTKGPDNRLIIVEGVGDLVLRNGKRIICIKLRRSDESGLEYAIDSADYLPPKWEVPAPLPEGVNGGAEAAGNAMPAGANNGIPGFGTPAQMQAMPYGAGGGQAQGRPGQYDVQIGQSQVIVPQYNNGAAGQNINVGYQPGAAANFDYSKCSTSVTTEPEPSSPILI